MLNAEQWRAITVCWAIICIQLRHFGKKSNNRKCLSPRTQFEYRNVFMGFISHRTNAWILSSNRYSRCLIYEWEYSIQFAKSRSRGNLLCVSINVSDLSHFIRTRFLMEFGITALDWIEFNPNCEHRSSSYQMRFIVEWLKCPAPRFYTQ